MFKGGEMYDDHRKVNEVAETLGARLNAYTRTTSSLSTSPAAPSGRRGDDLLTDFIGRPRSTPEQLDRERGVVLQEIARGRTSPGPSPCT